MEDNAGKIYLINGAEYKASEMEKQDKKSGRAAYEVIRVINGVPLFYQDHYERMKGTIETIGSPMAISAEQLAEDIKKLLMLNEINNCNVKIIMYTEGQNQKRLLYISKSYYPTEEETNAGTITGLLRLERQNPNAKLINQAYKDAVNTKMQESGYFEVILVDSSGRITEGSRSNAFFVIDNKIFTAPGEFVLKGITRKYVIDACKNAGYEVIEQFVGADYLQKIDGAFLSGTSIKVLPIASIDKLTLNSSANPVVAAVRREYNILIEKYIDNNVNIW